MGETSRWTDASCPDESGGRIGYNREIGTALNGDRWGAVGVGPEGEIKTHKTVEAGGKGENRNKVNGSDRS